MSGSGQALTVTGWHSAVDEPKDLVWAVTRPKGVHRPRRAGVVKRTKFCPAFAHDGYVEAIRASSNADHAVTNALDAIRFSAEGKMPS